MCKAKQVVCVMLFLALAACSRSQENIPVNKIADAILITYKTGPEIETTDLLQFWIKNTSNYCIVFPIDFGLQLYIQQGSSWRRIANIVEYQGQPGQEAVHLRPAGDIFSENIADAKPDLSGLNLTAPTNFRATITGHLCDDESIVVEKQIPFAVRP